VGRFLELAGSSISPWRPRRVFYTAARTGCRRNLYERVEVLTPVRDELLRERVRGEILEAYLADNLKPDSPQDGLHSGVASCWG